MTRIDHSNCTHPRTPAGRAVCRRDGQKPQAVETPPVAPTREQLVDGMSTKQRARFAAKMASDAAKSAGRLAKRAEANMRKANAKVTVVSELPMPNLTAVQLASPVFQSLLRHRKM